MGGTVTWGGGGGGAKWNKWNPIIIQLVVRGPYSSPTW
jgi:hypothetical protein